MADWSTTICPQSLLMDGFNETYPDTVLRTNMDVGPAKIRNRISYNTTPISGSMILTSSQATSFDTFYTNNKALEFGWVNPRTGSTCQMRFASVPKLERVDAYYRLILQLEIMP